MSPEVRWTFGPPRGLARALLRPLDLLRRGLTKGLEVEAAQPVARRGAELETLVTISSARGLEAVEVGLICTEYYDEENTNSEGHTSRSTAHSTAHEEWQRVETTAGVQNVRFTIPPGAPFSYEGDCLSFKWEVVVRGHRSSRLDAQAAAEISVRP